MSTYRMPKKTKGFQVAQDYHTLAFAVEMLNTLKTVKIPQNIISNILDIMDSLDTDSVTDFDLSSAETVLRQKVEHIDSEVCVNTRMDI